MNRSIMLKLQTDDVFCFIESTRIVIYSTKSFNYSVEPVLSETNKGHRSQRLSLSLSKECKNLWPRSCSQAGVNNAGDVIETITINNVSAALGLQNTTSKA
uniref:Uncharacterized protein n=1 Tax=Pararge aegeria TaxID=116150 RepID=S4NW33_9NEOP